MSLRLRTTALATLGLVAVTAACTLSATNEPSKAVPKLSWTACPPPAPDSASVVW